MKLKKSQLKELVKQALVSELQVFGSKAQYDAYRKKTKIKPGTKVKVDGKITTVRGSEPSKMSKSAKATADRMADKLNKRMADLLPRDLLLASEAEMLQAAKVAQAQGFKIPDDYYIQQQQAVKNMSLAELAAATSPEQVYGASGTMGEPLNKGVVEKPKNVISDMEREITGQTNVANPFDLDLSMIGSGLRGFSAAGGGIAKEAGVDSGAPPESGPNPQGLSYLMKRGKNI